MRRVARVDSPTEVSPQSDYDGPKIKRKRVALACLRCRSRKQKCDGAQNKCSTCRRLGLECRYKAHLTPRPDQKLTYIRELENHIAQLEELLAQSGHDAVTLDHWKEKRQQIRRDSYMADDTSNDPSQRLPATTKDPVWNAIMNSGFSDSTLSVGRLFKSVVHTGIDGTTASSISPDVSLLQNLAPPETAERLLSGYIEHLSTQYPVLHTPRLKTLHQRPVESLNIFEQCILHLVYANSGRMLEALGEAGPFHCDAHYEAALQHIDVVLALRDQRSVQILLLLALYCLRGAKSPGAWTLAGLAVRQCIELGLHRDSGTDEVTMERELKARIFWSCYYLDRGISVALGRPPAISDADIDVEFPLDVAEDVDDLTTLQEAARNRSQVPARPPTSLTPFIHFLRLRMIESKIEHVIYRLNRKAQADPDVLDTFIEQLTAWKDVIPEYHDRLLSTQKPHSNIDAFLIPYYKVIRLLLYSQLSKQHLNLRYLQLCADACAGLCGAYKRLNRMEKADCSPLALQSLFLSGVCISEHAGTQLTPAGLTLLYCAWLAPPGYLNVTNAISDCNLMLYVMSERSSAGQKYRDVFERIKMNVLDVVEGGTDDGGGVLDAAMTERCRSLNKGLLDTVRIDYNQIITSLAKDAGQVQVSSPSKAELSRQELATQLTTPPNWHMSPGPLLDYGVGHTFGTFIDAAFMFNGDDFVGFENADLDMTFDPALT